MYVSKVQPITREQIKEALTGFLSHSTIRHLPTQHDRRVLSGNYRSLKIPRAERQETAMSRVIEELDRLEE